MWRWTAKNFVLLGLLLGLTGCPLANDSPQDEEKDPHFLSGRGRVNSQDYKGAVEEFERALEVNPRSAAAHFELAVLYENQIKDFAAAIYHYERHLQLRPASPYARTAREHIRACKVDLAKTEFVLPAAQGMQHDLERAQNENLQLKRQIEMLQAQLASRAAPLPGTNRTVTSPPAPTIVPPAATPTDRPPERTRAPERPRVHVVKSGDTASAIARQYGVKLNALMAANPNVDARRLKVGQSLNIPPP